MLIKRTVISLALACLSAAAQAQTSFRQENAQFAARNPSGSLCADIADRINTRQDVVVFASKGRDSKIPRQIDVNGDGKMESVYYNGRNELIVRHGDGSAIPRWPEPTGYDDEPFSGDHRSLITYQGAVYVLTSGGTLPSIHYYDHDFRLHLACNFRQTEKDKKLIPLSRYESFIARSQAQDIDPLLLAIRQQDIDALRLLVENGHDLNKNRGADQTSYLGEAVFLLSAKPDAEKFIASMLDLGASPGAASDGNFQVPIYMAIHGENPRLVGLLINRGAYIDSPYHNPNGEVIEQFKDRGTREDLLLMVARRRGVIDDYALYYALKDGASAGFLRELVSTNLPLEGNLVSRVNGQVVANDPMVTELARARKDHGEALSLLAGLRRNAPKIGSEVHLGFWYETDTRVVYFTFVPVTRSTPPYSQSYEKSLMNFATSVCMHVIGGACGSENDQRDAAKWLDALPVTCSAELSESFDQPVCKLALYWIAEDNYGIYLRVKANPGTEEAPRQITSIGAFSELGRRSLMK